MLEEFAVSAQTGTEPLSFHGVFERQAAACKEKTALIAVDGRWSYEGLDREMNRAANGLISRGFCPGDTAVVLLPRLGRQIIAMYGVMKAGGRLHSLRPGISAGADFADYKRQRSFFYHYHKRAGGSL